MTMNVNSGKPWSPVDVYDLRQGLERGTAMTPWLTFCVAMCPKSEQKLYGSACSEGAVAAITWLRLQGGPSGPVAEAHNLPGPDLG